MRKKWKKQKKSPSRRTNNPLNINTNYFKIILPISSLILLPSSEWQNLVESIEYEQFNQQNQKITSPLF